MANVCCSIEMEPRTLNQGQLNHAREMAADEAQKRETTEASALLIEGLGLMSGTEIKEETELTVLTDEEEKKVVVEKHVEYCNQKAQNIVERPCQCSCNSNIESPDPNNIILNNLKEPVTAPF